MTVLPQKVEALWGYTVNVKVDKISTANVGTKENPVASLTLDLKYDVSTIIKKGKYSAVYDFRGDRATVNAVDR